MPIHQIARELERIVSLDQEVEELGSGGNWPLEGHAVRATHVAADEQWVDVREWIKRRDMAP